MIDRRTQEDLDRKWMGRALELARRHLGFASPNPTVGCVLVNDGKVVGEGFHDYALRDHAEVVGLRQAGASARYATAYVTLEPCSHHGRTGPCADALIAAGVTRVVAATADANPAVHGHGIERLRQAGIEVTVGILEQPARRLNDAFAKYIRTGFPFVTLKAAMSLDGRIAPPASERKPGEISWITGPESRAHVHQLRHSVDAILTGIGTVRADDPLLTDRSELPRRRPLLRVVVDSGLRLPLDSKLVRSANHDLLVVSAKSSDDSGTSARDRKIAALSAAGVAVEEIAHEGGEIGARPALPALLKRLGEMQLSSLLVEGGTEMNSSFLGGDLVDRLYLFYAPYFLGSDAQPLLRTASSQARAFEELTLHRFDPDFAIEGRLSDYWRP